VHPQLQRGDDAEVAAAATDRPEQLLVRRRVGAHQGAVSDDHLDGGQAVRGQAELARVPAHAAAEGVAGDAHVRGRPVQHGVADLGGRVDRGLPQGPAADPDDPACGVDPDLGQGGGVHDDDVVEALRGERTGVVPGGLRRDPQAGGRGGTDDGGHVRRVPRDGDGCGQLADGDVPRRARGVVPGVAGEVDVSAAQAAQGLRAGVAGGVVRRQVERGHGVTP
jgi:hypothetical protein